MTNNTSGSGSGILEPEVMPVRAGIKVAELGRRPKLIDLLPDEGGRSIQQLITEGSLADNMEYYVNGERARNDSMVLAGDAVVSVPRIRGGIR